MRCVRFSPVLAPGRAWSRISMARASTRISTDTAGLPGGASIPRGDGRVHRVKVLGRRPPDHRHLGSTPSCSSRMQRAASTGSDGPGSPASSLLATSGDGQSGSKPAPTSEGRRTPVYARRIHRHPTKRAPPNAVQDSPPVQSVIKLYMPRASSSGRQGRNLLVLKEDINRFGCGWTESVNGRWLRCP